MKRRILSVLSVVLFSGICFGQMSYDEAQKKIAADRKAAENAPSTRISLEDLSILKTGIQKLGKEKVDLEKQLADLKSKTPATPQVGWKLDYLQHCSWAKVQDLRQAFNVQPNGELSPGTPGQRQAVTTSTVIQPRANAGVTLTRVSHDLRQWEKYQVIYNTGGGEPANAFRSVGFLVDIDTGTIMQIDGAESPAQVALIQQTGGTSPRTVPTTAEEQLIAANKTLSDQLSPMLDQNGKLNDSLNQQKSLATQLQAKVAAEQQKSGKLASDLDTARRQLENQPAVVPVIEASAPVPTGMYLRVNALNVTLGVMILLTVIVIAIRLAAR